MSLPLPLHPEPWAFKWSELEVKTIKEYGQACRAQALEEAALFIERGNFLHDQSPAKLFAEQLAPKIRRLK